MKLEFPYLRIGQQYFPVIDLKIKGKRSSFLIKALVDSGASFSVFRHEIADYLGIKLEKGKQIYLEGIGGRILGYLHNLSVTIGEYSYKLKIVFSRELTISFSLLGRDNFFEPFLITFAEKSKKIIIEETLIN
jgi:hypothetical protein